MSNIYSSKTLELILNNLSQTLEDTKIKLFLNAPSSTEIVSIDTTFSLALSAEAMVKGKTAPIDTSINLSFSGVLPAEANGEYSITIPALDVVGESIEKAVPLTLALKTDDSIDFSGISKGKIPKLQVTASASPQEVSLPISGSSSGELNLLAETVGEIPSLIATGKTKATELNVDVIGSTTQGVKFSGKATGKLPQLKVTGNTTKSPLELELQANTVVELNDKSTDPVDKPTLNRTSSTDLYLSRYLSSNSKAIKLKIKGKASGMIKPIPISGLTEPEEISLPMIDESNYSLSLNSTGKLRIPEQNITLTTNKKPLNLSTTFNSNLTLDIEGTASGTIPSSQVTGFTKEHTIVSEIIGKTSNPLTFNLENTVEIPSLKMKGKTSPITLPLNITKGSSYVNTTNSETTITVPATNISGKVQLENIPVTGTISAIPNCIKKYPSFYGYLSKIENSLLYLRDDNTNNLLALNIDSISHFTFKTESSIISTNKFSNIQSFSNIEKALINIWYTDCIIELYGTNTSNPINKKINTEDIKYINKGVMWTEEYLQGRIINTIYYIYNLCGFSLINS